MKIYRKNTTSNDSAEKINKTFAELGAKRVDIRVQDNRADWCWLKSQRKLKHGIPSHSHGLNEPKQALNHLI